MLHLFPTKIIPGVCVLRYLSTVLTSVSEREFIEGRRRALGRFINLVARHPIFSEDELVKTFLTFNGSVCSFVLNSLPGSVVCWLLQNKPHCHGDCHRNASCSGYSLSFPPLPLLTLLPKKGCSDQAAWCLQENGRWVHDQQNCHPGKGLSHMYDGKILTRSPPKE